MLQKLVKVHVHVMYAEFKQTLFLPVQVYVQILCSLVLIHVEHNDY